MVERERDVKEDIGVWCADEEDEATSTKDYDCEVDGVRAEGDRRSCFEMQSKRKP